jgi:hypothetical protein
MAIDLNTLLEEEGENVPSLNKSPAEHEEDQNPLEDVGIRMAMVRLRIGQRQPPRLGMRAARLGRRVGFFL